MEYFEKILNSETGLQIFHTLFENYSCIRCILKFFLIDRHDLYRDKNIYFELLHNVSNKLQLSKDLIEDYDFKNLMKKNQIEEQKITEEKIQTAKIQNNFIQQDSLCHIQVDQSNICRTCLGILQHADNESFVSQLLQAIKSDAYEFNEFKFSIRIPLSIYIRFQQQIAYTQYKLSQQNISLYGFEQLFNVNKDENLDVKVIFRSIILPFLQKELNCSCNMANDAYTLNIELANNDDENQQFSYFAKALLTASEIQKQKKKKIKYNPQIVPTELINYKISQQTIEQLSKFSNYDFLSYVNNQAVPEVYPKSNWYFWSWHLQIYLEGRYLKLNRNLSQTIWVVDGKKLYESSVEEEVANIIAPCYNAQTFKFHSGGREDIDVRMLGKGRPFALELVNPKKALSITSEQIQLFEEGINKMLSDIKCFDTLLKAQDQKLKAYCSVIYCSRALNSEDIKAINQAPAFTINQKTPIRVLHRRSLLTRPRQIYSMHIIHLSQHKFFKLFLLSQAGTYIKEFIHGDLQRTVPNLGTLMNAECDILQLDVIEVFEKSDQKEEDEISVAIKSFNEVVQEQESAFIN